MLSFIAKTLPPYSVMFIKHAEIAVTIQQHKDTSHGRTSVCTTENVALALLVDSRKDKAMLHSLWGQVLKLLHKKIEVNKERNFFKKALDSKSVIQHLKPSKGNTANS